MGVFVNGLLHHVGNKLRFFQQRGLFRFQLGGIKEQVHHLTAVGDSGSDTFPHPILPKPFYGAPGTVCNESYLVIGPFKDETECRNVMSYIATKFFRFLVLQKKNSQNAARGVYQFVPQQDFSKPWTDEELYKKYGITAEEIEFIDSMIRPMDLEGDSDGN